MYSQNYLYTLLFLINTPHVIAAEATESESVIMPTFSVMAPRLEQTTLETANTIYELDQFELEKKLPRNLPEALIAIPGVMVQKTANGQGSLFVRGFTGYRTLTLMGFAITILFIEMALMNISL